MRIFKKPLFILLSFLLLHGANATAIVNASLYGLPPITDNKTLDAGTERLMDSLMAVHPMLSSKNIVDSIVYPRMATSHSADFYLLICLCLVLGVIRYSDPRYFTMLWRAFRNPTLSNRQLKEQLQGAGLLNVLMNLFFTMAGGAYIYYVVKILTPKHTEVVPAALLIVMLIGGMMIIYSVKYAAVKFSGWAFRVEGITEHYLFNVFLINKILSIILVPFIILLAFSGQPLAQPMVVVSLVVVGILLVNRYIRSWQVFGSFFQYSKFHFFTYLCASELLPLAVLMKLLVKGLLFY